MRLLYITNQICGPGGLERVLSIKANYLAEKLNYDVYIITLNQGTFELSNKFNKKCNYYNVKNKEQLKHIYRDIKALIKKLKKTTINLISIYNAANKGLFAPLLRG